MIGNNGKVVLQIVPRLPPAVCGVADHAIALGDSLVKSWGYDVRYVAINPIPQPLKIDSNHQLTCRSADALLTFLQEQNLPPSSTLIVHFSGYSYGKRGVCFWLTNALRRFLEQRPNINLITMFHELWSPAPLLSKSGVTIPFQKMIVSKLIQLSKAVHTNRQAYGNQIRNLCPSFNGPVTIQNIFSNFGEPIGLPEFSSRKPQILIFQPPDLNTKGGKLFWEGWKRLRQQLGYGKTIVAGRTQTIPADSEIQAVGYVSAELGATLMLDSQVAYLDYYDGYLGKSSIFSSFAAHGLAPVMQRVNHSQLDGILHRKHYLLPDDDELNDMASLRSIGHEIRSWYLTHSLAATTCTYANEIESFSENGTTG
ncbi:hypothetical protein [Rosistilla oblonga]|uniref:hypothetical protein n=1 Tax=Rosistilla oblonga TaxID=2527990 RepID=UPI003A983644